jgi:hypothetical protein
MGGTTLYLLFIILNVNILNSQSKDTEWYIVISHVLKVIVSCILSGSFGGGVVLDRKIDPVPGSSY